MRQRFNRMAIASSRGIAVYNSHVAYIKQKHEELMKNGTKITITSTKYYTTCWGDMFEISKADAYHLMSVLGKDSVVVKRTKTTIIV